MGKCKMYCKICKHPVINLDKVELICKCKSRSMPSIINSGIPVEWQGKKLIGKLVEAFSGLPYIHNKVDHSITF